MILWFLLTLACLFLQASFSMIEMAALSFNRIRLQYLVSQGVKRAIWLQELLLQPYRLFGTVMLGVNCALQIGSQSAREFYLSLNLNPNWAPITQIFLVVVLGELAPLFAARRCSEHVIMLYTPFVYSVYRLFYPLISVISLVIKGIYRLTGRVTCGIEFSREQLQKLLETPEEESDTFCFLVTNILAFRTLTIRPFTYRLVDLEVLPTTALVSEVRVKLEKTTQAFIPLYEKSISNITYVVPISSLVKAKQSDPIINYAKKIPLLSANCTLKCALEKMIQLETTSAIVKGEKKGVLGVVQLETIFERLFCNKGVCMGKQKSDLTPVIERSVPGNMRIVDFNREYGTALPEGRAETLAQLMMTHLEGAANTGDHIAIGQLGLAAEETGLTGIKTVRVKSLTT